MTQPMTTQQPFESLGPIMTTNTPDSHTQMDRFEKMDFLRDTCAQDLINKTLPEELLMFMSDEYFSQFYEHFCSCYDICRSSEELNQRYGE